MRVRKIRTVDGDIVISKHEVLESPITPKERAMSDINFNDYTRADLAETITAEAEDWVDNGWAATIGDATKSILEENPDLAAAYFSKSDEAVVPVVQIEKSFEEKVQELKPPQTFYEAAAAAVTRQAHKLKQEFVNVDKSVEQLEFEILKSVDGSRLYDVAVSPIGRQPIAQVRAITKAYGAPRTTTDEAMEILARFAR